MGQRKDDGILMNYIFRTLIVPAASVQLARQIATSFGPGGEGMWITPLSASGLDPATHYISSGYVPPEYGYLVPLQVWAQDEDGNWVLVSSEPGDPVTVYTAATAQGVICTQQDIDNLFATVDVTEQEPFVAMGRLGLTIINPVDNI
jgi:hypothetical protein